MWRTLKLLVAGTVLALGLLLVGVCVGRYIVPRTTTTAPATEELPQVEKAQPVKRARKARRQPLPPQACAGLTEIADKDLLVEVARRHRLPDLVRPEMVDGVEVPRSLLSLTTIEGSYRWGAELATTLRAGADTPETTAIPLEPPRFAFRDDLRFEIGPGAIIVVDASEDDRAARLKRAYGMMCRIDLRLAQTRRWDHGITVTGFASSDPFVLASYTVGTERSLADFFRRH